MVLRRFSRFICLKKDMDDFEEKACLCALNRIFGFEPVKALALIEHFGCGSAVFAAGKEELDILLGPHCRQKFLIRQAAVFEAADELERLGRSGTTFIGWGQEGYPELLAECPDPPAGLYIRSTTRPRDLWRRSGNIAIVGTRDISPYGMEWCGRIVEALADTGQKPVIVSGLALGTDIKAHKSAVRCGLPTVAVMPTGPDSVYPFRHLGFAEEMYRIPGCALVTDYPSGTAPLPVNFLRRNRIIAGLSNATVLIESKVKGGGMMTARLAFSYDRDVYALPGRIDDLRSGGCNRLIADKIAEPIASPEGLICALGLSSPGKRVFGESLSMRMRSTYAGRHADSTIDSMDRILAAVAGNRGITIEEAARAAGMEYRKAASLVSMLETDGFLYVDLLQRCSIITGKKQ